MTMIKSKQLKFPIETKRASAAEGCDSQPPRESGWFSRWIARNSAARILNAGGGTYITGCPPNEAEQELIDMFIGREIESMDLLN